MKKKKGREREVLDHETIFDHIGGRLDPGINKLIGEILRSVPDDPQMNVNALRAVHQVLAYHLGTVERMIEHRCELADAAFPVGERIVEEREDFIAKGMEHADVHTRHYLN